MRIFSSISARSCEETEERNWRIAVETIAFGVVSESLSTRFNFAEGFPARIHGKLGLSTDDEREKSRSLFLRQGTKVAEVPWRLYHTYFYTEYFNNNDINICTSWSCPDGASDHALNTMRTHESLYTFPVLSRRSTRARTPERLLYKEAIEQLE